MQESKIIALLFLLIFSSQLLTSQDYFKKKYYCTEVSDSLLVFELTDKDTIVQDSTIFLELVNQVYTSSELDFENHIYFSFVKDEFVVLDITFQFDSDTYEEKIEVVSYPIFRPVVRTYRTKYLAQLNYGIYEFWDLKEIKDKLYFERKCRVSCN